MHQQSLLKYRILGFYWRRYFILLTIFGLVKPFPKALEINENISDKIVVGVLRLAYGIVEGVAK